MSSEIIVVLVLGLLAVGFIIWVRMHDEKAEQRGKDEKGESSAQ